MKDYNLGIISPGESKPLNVVGDYIRNIGQGSIKVTALNNKKSVKAFSTVIGPAGSRSPKDEYTTWQIENNSSVAIDVSVLIGQGEATESEVKVSADVNALTRSDNISTDLRSFMKGYFDGAQVGEFSNMALYNPAASGKDVVINDLLVNHGSQNVNFGYLTTFPAGTYFETDNSIYCNKFLGKAGPSAKLYTMLSGFTSAYINANIYKITPVPTDSSTGVTSFNFGAEPYIVPPDHMFFIYGGTENTSISASIAFKEESVNG